MTTTRTVRSFRKEFALTQEELADLLSISQTAISRLENETEASTLETSLGLQVVFGVPPHALFPRLYEAVEEAVMARAAKLDRRLSNKQDPKALKNKRLLTEMSIRATAVATRA